MLLDSGTPHQGMVEKMLPINRFARLTPGNTVLLTEALNRPVNNFLI